jgi:hypothetical protein
LDSLSEVDDSESLVELELE